VPCYTSASDHSESPDEIKAELHWFD